MAGAPALRGAAPAPIVVAAYASPSALPANGGQAVVVGVVRGASTCKVEVTSGHGLDITVPGPFACSSGTVDSQVVSIGPNPSTSRAVVGLVLFAGHARGEFYITVAGQVPQPGAMGRAGARENAAGRTASAGVPDAAVAGSEMSAIGQACSKGTVACREEELSVIDRWRSAEHLGPLRLPTYYSELTLAEKIAVLADLERSARGLPCVTGLSVALGTLAEKGAAASTDAAGPSGTDWGSNWYQGPPSALEVDYSWMYDDGPGGTNLDCQSGDMSGCWGHRENILGNYGPHPSMGVAVAQISGSYSIEEIFSSGPAGVLSWATPPGLCRE